MSNVPAIENPTVRIRTRGRVGIFKLTELTEFRFLLYRLAKRDIILRYRQTALGVTWVVLQPLLASGVLAFAFGSVAKLPSEGVPYYVLSFAGFLGWSAFAAVIAKSTTALVSNSALVSKVYFPRLFLPVSTIGSTLIDVAVGLVVMIVILLISGVGVSWTIVFVPLFVVGFLLLATGIGCAAAALAVPYRDVAFIIPVVTNLLLYGSPVAYSLSAMPASAQRIMKFNPLTGYLEAMRWALLPGRHLNVGLVVQAFIVSATVLFGGLTVFSRFERGFADVI
jgi:lipopolysaccharide transport system permease protein